MAFQLSLRAASCTPSTRQNGNRLSPHVLAGIEILHSRVSNSRAICCGQRVVCSRLCTNDTKLSRSLREVSLKALSGSTSSVGCSLCQAGTFWTGAGPTALHPCLGLLYCLYILRLPYLLELMFLDSDEPRHHPVTRPALITLIDVCLSEAKRSIDAE